MLVLLLLWHIFEIIYQFLLQREEKEISGQKRRGLHYIVYFMWDISEIWIC